MKHLLTLLLFSALLTACAAEQATLSPAPVSTSPTDPAAAPSAASETASPQPSATLIATAELPRASSTPLKAETGYGWCADGIASCFDDGYSFPLTRPIPTTIDPTYRFASTQNGDREIHHGVEFYQASGTPVLAAGAGTVAFAGDDMTEKVALWPGFYGNYVVIEHTLAGQAVFTLYGHLSKMDVQTGETVAAGQKIGEVGASGSAIGSHLHFEVRPGQDNYFAARNPEMWFAPLEGAGALAGRIFDPDNPKVRGAVRIQRMQENKIADFPAYQPMDIYPAELVIENGENFALTDLSAGPYRLTYLYSGKVYEYFVEIRPGILTLITIVLD
ncbi:MAG: hypothetical protein CVU44_00615 [Chloroflexi bacterium HGW-Chloroflexi-6]|nr:MAG: hypothetical protein CVU44_00615 [Chloroflexi bacterium HGW-Chloroflexi-6]